MHHRYSRCRNNTRQENAAHARHKLPHAWYSGHAQHRNVEILGGLGGGIREFCVARSGDVERTVRLDMVERHALDISESFQCADLIDNAGGKPLGRIRISRRPKPCRSGNDGCAQPRRYGSGQSHAHLNDDRVCRVNSAPRWRYRSGHDRIVVAAAKNTEALKLSPIRKLNAFCFFIVAPPS